MKTLQKTLKVLVSSFDYLYQHLCCDIIRVVTPIVQENTVAASCALLAGINTRDCETRLCWPIKKITLFNIFFLYHQKYHCCEFPSNIWCHFEAIASTHKRLNETVQLRIIGWMLFQLNFYNLYQYSLNLLPTHEKLNAAACILHLKACGPCVDVFSSVPYTDADFNDSNCGWWREPFSLVPNWINLYKSYTLTTEQ